MSVFVETFYALTWQQAVMILVGCLLIYLAVAKDYEPALLLPMGFGTLMVNVPFTAALDQIGPAGELIHGAVQLLYSMGIANELFPLLIFIGIGAMTDFTPLLRRPRMALFGLTAQAGIFLTLVLALWLGFPLNQAGSIAVIGAADGPTSIFVAGRFAREILGPITVAAYSYMALVPVIQPPVMKLLTTKAERRIRMAPVMATEVPRWVRLAFPIAVTLIVAFIAPASTTLMGFLMFGNLLRESGVVDRLAKGAQEELTNIVTILLGLAISFTMQGNDFLTPMTLSILALGLVAFILDTAVGVLSAKIFNLFWKEKVNPLVGAAGISAFPMASRVAQRVATAEEPGNFILMYSSAANVAGQIGSVIAGGVLLALLG